MPNEFLEKYFPMIIERYESVADSGGAGRYRGGNGIHMTYRFTESGTIAIHDDRWFVPPWGVNGGEPGARSWKKLVRASGEESFLPSKCDNVQVNKDDILHFVTWGGGGWGDPLEREVELLELEIKRGLVTARGALRFGVVASETGEIDAPATAALRARLKGSRKPLQVFDRGPDIETLRANSLAETGLPAPRAPVWRSAPAMAAE